MRRTLATSIPALLLSVALAGLQGCFLPTRAAADRLERPAPPPLPADAWPARDPQAARDVLARTPAKFPVYVMADGVTEDQLDDAQRRALVTQRVLGIAEPAGSGIIRSFEEVAPSEPAPVDARGVDIRTIDSWIYGFQPTAWFLSSHELSPDATRRRTSRASLAERLRRTGWVDPMPSRLQTNPIERDLLVDTGVALRIPGPSPTPYRGLILHLPALRGNGFEQAVVDELASRGWAVVSVRASTLINPPLSDSQCKRFEEIENQIIALANEIKPPAPENARTADVRRRLQELSAEYRAVREGCFECASLEDVDSLGARIAATIDDRLAEAAYGAEAVLEHLARHRPDIPTRPLVIAGFSAGSLAAPTVAARLGRRVDGLIVVGSGADVFRVTQESDLTDAGVKLKFCGRKPTEDEIDRIDEAYLRHTRLDPVKTAPLLRNTAVLQVHGMFDGWVPARCGRMLTHALDYPDMLTAIGGHQLLFYFLPEHKGTIADWAEFRTFGVKVAFPGDPPQIHRLPTAALQTGQ